MAVPRTSNLFSSQFFSMIVSILMMLTCAAPLCAVSGQNRPDGWAGMVLNVSRLEDAVRLFGTPAKDKDKVALDLPRTVSWLSNSYKEKLFRTITYKKIHGYKQVGFSFRDGKLVSITMEAPDAEVAENWIDPDDLEDLFGVVFKPHLRKRNSKLPPPTEFQANAPTELEKSDYDFWYDMIAVSENSFVIAIADNYKYPSRLLDTPDIKRRKKINARGARYPGYVSHIEILSRVLAAP